MSDTLELSALRLCVKNSTFLGRARKRLESFRFGNWVRDWVWRTCVESYSEHGEAPGFRVLAEKASHSFKTEELPEALAELRKLRKSPKLESPRSALGELAEQLRLQRGAVVADELVTAIEKKDTEGIEDAIRKAGVTRSREREGDSGVLDVAKRILSLKGEDPAGLFVPTGFTYIDRRWRGIKLGELALYIAITSGGKSVSIVQTGAKAVSKGIPTLVITTEMDKTSQASRFISRFTGIPEEHIREGRLTKSERAFLNRWMRSNWDRLNPLLRLEHFPPGTCSIADVRDALMEQQRKGVPPKLLLIDSLDQIRGRGKFKDKRDDETEMYYEVQSLGEEFGCATVATTQVAKVWAGRVATAEAIGENYNKSRVAQWVISINPIKGEDGEERSFMYVAKRRSGKRGILVPLVCDLERMRMDTAPEPADEDAV